MSAFHALDAARAAGIEVQLDGKDLIVSAASEPPADVLDMLRRHKPSIVGLLQQRYIVGTPVQASAGAIAALGAGTGGTGSTPVSASSDIIAPACAGTDVTDLAAGDTDSTVRTTEGSATGGITNAVFGGTGSADSTALDWLAFYDEKAGIAEYVHGMSRPEAEKCAVEHCVSEWLSRNQVDSDANYGCVVCGDGDRANDILLAVGLGGAGQAWGLVWVHRECAPAWRAGRIAEAVAALAAMGIGTRPAAA